MRIESGGRPGGPLIIVPAYNEAATIRDVVLGCLKHAITVLVVNDGSTDPTASMAENAGARVVSHQKRMGKGAAIRTGFHFAGLYGSPFAITLDADSQHDPSEISLFLDEFSASSHDIIIGDRLWDSGKIPFIRYWANRSVTSLINRYLGIQVGDSQSGFRLYSRRAMRLETLSPGFEMESEILIKAASKSLQVGSIRISALYPSGIRRSRFRALSDTVRVLRTAVSCLAATRISLT